MITAEYNMYNKDVFAFQAGLLISIQKDAIPLSKDTKPPS
jgi:hypothetical protein